jgi:hypothetical protein
MALATLVRRYFVEARDPVSNRVIAEFVKPTEELIFNDHRCDDGRIHNLIQVNDEQLEVLSNPRGSLPDARFTLWCQHSTAGPVIRFKDVPTKQKSIRRFSPEAVREVKRMKEQPGLFAV